MKQNGILVNGKHYHVKFKGTFFHTIDSGIDDNMGVHVVTCTCFCLKRLMAAMVSFNIVSLCFVWSIINEYFVQVAVLTL